MENEHDKIGTRLELIITKLNNGEREIYTCQACH